MVAVLSGGPTGIRTQNQRIMLYHFGFRRRLEAVRGLDHAFTIPPSA